MSNELQTALSRYYELYAHVDDEDPHRDIAEALSSARYLIDRMAREMNQLMGYIHGA